ncbi:MAG: hypothetical protein JF585_09035 [Burkholderiales bacterium]|nr:hypothetical protein [Burkholderiales bacterium]
MSDQSPEPELPAGAPPSSAPWLSTQHEMQSAARPVRTRVFRMRDKSGHLRVAAVTYFQSVVRSDSDSRVEHMYRVQLSWLLDFDPRDGKAERYAERTGTSRPTNALEFRVLEMAAPDGQRLSAARLGPKGQISADPPNMGVMSLLRALLVEWVGERHPDATVLTGSLYQVAVQAEATMALRDGFFARSGFTVKPIGDSGTFYAHSIRALKTAWNPDKATELTTPLIAEAVSAQLEAPVLRQQITALQDQLAMAIKEKRATEVLSRIWLAITVLAVIFGLIFGIQPRLG